MELLVLALSFVIILLGAELFTNGIEWFGRKLELAEGAVGSVLAAVGTALPETMIPIIAIGFATGENRAREAAERALRSPLIDTEIVGARGILLSIAGGEDLSLLEVNEAAQVVRQAATDDTNIIFGATVDERLAGQMWVTVVATGLAGTRRRGSSPSFTGAAVGAGVHADDLLEPPRFLRD